MTIAFHASTNNNSEVKKSQLSVHFEHGGRREDGVGQTVRKTPKYYYNVFFFDLFLVKKVTSQLLFNAAVSSVCHKTNSVTISQAASCVAGHCSLINVDTFSTTNA